MKDKKKTKTQLITELTELRKRNAELIILETERKKVEESLFISEKKYRDLIETTPDLIWEVDKEGLYTYISPKVKEFLGYEVSEVLGKSAFDFMIEEEAKKIGKFYKNIVMKEKPFYGLQNIMLHKDGHPVIFESNGVPIFDEKSRLKGYRGIDRDIIDRKNAEESLRLKRNRLISIFEAMEDGIFIVNQNHDIEYMNPILQRDPGPYEGQKCFEYFHDRKNVCPWCKKDEVFAGKTVRWEWYSFKNQRTYDLIDKPLKNPDGSISKLEIFHDITERKQEEEEKVELLHDFEKLVNELNCLYSLSKLAEQEHITLEEIFMETVDIIPSSWQYPDITCSRIVFEGHAYKTANFKKTKWKQSAKIKVHAVIVGEIEIFYLEKKPVLDEGPFLNGERNLIDAIAEQLGRIIEYKQTGEALREENEFNFALFEYNPIETIAVDTEGIITNFNLAKKKSGDRLPAIGDVMYRDYAGRHEIDMYTELLECIRTGKSKEFPKKKYGDRFLTINIAPYPHGAVITSQDITERKRAEEALKESEEKYRKIVENIYDIVYSSYADGTIHFISPNVLSIIGFKPEEIIGHNPIELVHPDDREHVLSDYEKTIKKGEEFPTIFRLLKKDGSYFYVEEFGKVVREGDEIVGVTGVLRDITDRKHMEENLRKSESELRKQKLALEQKNIALREIIAQIEVEKNKIRDDVITNIHVLILPVLEKFKLKGVSNEYIDLLSHLLEKLSSSFGRKITKISYRLTPREIEISTMIESGLMNKEISRILNISHNTIEKHRENIRKKLGIYNKNINLRSFLMQLPS